LLLFYMYVTNFNRFNYQFDQKIGIRTKQLMCVPIIDDDGEVLGVANFVNNVLDIPFGPDDEVKIKISFHFFLKN